MDADPTLPANRCFPFDEKAIPDGYPFVVAVMLCSVNAVVFALRPSSSYGVDKAYSRITFLFFQCPLIRNLVPVELNAMPCALIYFNTPAEPSPPVKG
jgi:hypothetical protein